jgi:hypothetical protein
LLTEESQRAKKRRGGEEVGEREREREREYSPFTNVIASALALLCLSFSHFHIPFVQEKIISTRHIFLLFIWSITFNTANLTHFKLSLTISALSPFVLKYKCIIQTSSSSLRG